MQFPTLCSRTPTVSSWLDSSFIYSSDITLCTVNEDGDFELTFGNERTYTLMEKLDKLLNGPDTYNFKETDYAPSKHIAESGQNNFASWFAKYENGSRMEIEEFNRKISDMD